MEDYYFRTETQGFKKFYVVLIFSEDIAMGISPLLKTETTLKIFRLNVTTYIVGFGVQ